MTTIRPTVRTRLAVLACLAILVAGFSACAAPKKGADRFVGTFRWQQPFGYQAIAFAKAGKAQYITALPDDNNDDSTVVESRPSTYRVSGDTAFLVVDWGKPDTENAPLTMLLRGDSLIMLDQVLGGNPVFMRDK
jgi:hypothetical protein